MTSQGSAHGRLVRALDGGNPLLALAAAAELPHVALPEALGLVATLAGHDPERYPRAAARWAGRFALEERGVRIAEVQLVVAALVALGDRPAAAAAAAALERVLDRHERGELAEALRRWAR